MEYKSKWEALEDWVRKKIANPNSTQEYLAALIHTSFKMASLNNQEPDRKDYKEGN
jgi:hypothetical protein